MHIRSHPIALAFFDAIYFSVLLFKRIGDVSIFYKAYILTCFTKELKIGALGYIAQCKYTNAMDGRRFEHKYNRTMFIGTTPFIPIVQCNKTKDYTDADKIQ